MTTTYDPNRGDHTVDQAEHTRNTVLVVSHSMALVQGNISFEAHSLHQSIGYDHTRNFRGDDGDTPNHQNPQMLHSK